MLPAPNNLNCVEYLEYCTGRYDDVYMMQHFGIKYLRSEILGEIDRLAAYFQKELGLKKGDVYTIFMSTSMQSIIAFYALNKIGVIASFVHPLMGTDYLKEQLELVHSKGVMVLARVFFLPRVRLILKPSTISEFLALYAHHLTIQTASKKQAADLAKASLKNFLLTSSTTIHITEMQSRCTTSPSL